MDVFGGHRVYFFYLCDQCNLFYSNSGTVLYAVNSELCAVYGSVLDVIVGPITISFDLRPVYKSLLLCAVQSKHCITFLNLIW